MASTSESEPAAAPARTASFSTFEWLLLGTFAALLLVARIALHLPIKVPGHSGVVWMALLVVARAAVPKPGAATATGTLAGLVAMLVGVGDRGALATLLGSAAAGLGVDAVYGASTRQPWILQCALAGLAGNVAKLAAKIVLEMATGIPAGFVVLGRIPALLTHAVFGIAGGLIGFLVVRALQRAGYFAYLASRRS
jgi:ABC-type thiamin/hydroxymethylpyrimidine transport system permease subunit